MSDDEESLTPDPSPQEPLIPGPSPLGAARRERAWQSQQAPTSGSTDRVPAQRVAVGGEGQRWHQALPAIADRLREIGYDIASPQSGAPPGGSIVARRDLGDRAVVLAIDAGGRFRAEITWVVGEWPSQDKIAGVMVNVVDAVSRAVTVTGQVSGPEQVVEVVTGLGMIASWVDVANSDAPPPLP